MYPIYRNMISWLNKHNLIKLKSRIRRTPQNSKLFSLFFLHPFQPQKIGNPPSASNDLHCPLTRAFAKEHNISILNYMLYLM